MPSTPSAFNRQEIERIVGNNPSLIRKFEQMMQQTTEFLPDQLEAVTVLASIAGQLASDAREAAQAAQNAADDLAQIRALIDSAEQRFREMESWSDTFGARVPTGVIGPSLAIADSFATFPSNDGERIGSTSVTDAAVLLQGSGLDVDAAGYRGRPQNSQSGSYTTVAADAGKCVYHPNGAGAGDTYTIDSNANVAYEVGTVIGFINRDPNTVAIAITADTLIFSPSGGTGTRTLAQFGVAFAEKVAATEWLIYGFGIT